MKIGFIGYGSMARALAGRWAGQHELFIGGRNAEKAAALATELGHDTPHGSPAQAVDFADVVVPATPHQAVFDAIAEIGADAFAGTTLIDINNPVPGAFDGDFLVQQYDGRSLAEAIADAAPGARVVKAFNMCQAKVWEMDPPVFDGRRLVTMICGDDTDAKATVAALVEAVGSEPLDVGGLPYARQLEACASLVIKLLLSGHDPYTVLNLIQPEVKPFAE
ncbi:MAG: NAD(P)-binding domain-containing protein [Planctomycetota bacterium]